MDFTPPITFPASRSNIPLGSVGDVDVQETNCDIELQATLIPLSLHSSCLEVVVLVLLVF